MACPTDEEELYVYRKDLLSYLNQPENDAVAKLFRHTCDKEYNKNRSQFYDKLAILDCCIDIILSKIENDVFVIDWCLKIQNSLCNEDIRAGWKVCFEVDNEGRQNYFYINDKQCKKKQIKFNHSHEVMPRKKQCLEKKMLQNHTQDTTTKSH